MINEEFQPDTSEKSLPTRKSRIIKHLRRTIQTGQYESLVIENGIDEEIEWTTLDERRKKVANWESLLIENFKVFHDKACQELGVSHKCAYIKEPKTKSTGPAQTNSINNLEELDELDQISIPNRD